MIGLKTTGVQTGMSPAIMSRKVAMCVFSLYVFSPGRNRVSWRGTLRTACGAPGIARTVPPFLMD
jgi:hypothetical protein